VSVTKDRERR